MKNPSRSWFVIAAFGASFGCASSAQTFPTAHLPDALPQASPSVSARQVRHGTRAPLVVQMRELKRSPTSSIVIARVERRDAIHTPITVSIELPAEARLVRGPLKAELPASTSAGETEYEFELSYASAPTGDFKVVAEFKTATSGARAVGTYRFGRAETVAPAAKGTDAKMGNWNLGPSVKMQ